VCFVQIWSDQGAASRNCCVKLQTCLLQELWIQTQDSSIWYFFVHLSASTPHQVMCAYIHMSISGSASTGFVILASWVHGNPITFVYQPSFTPKDCRKHCWPILNSWVISKCYLPLSISFRVFTLGSTIFAFLHFIHSFYAHNFILITCLSLWKGFRIPSGWRDFSFDHCVKTGVGPTQLTLLNISGAFFPWYKVARAWSWPLVSS
jgi:hypothetical protein